MQLKRTLFMCVKVCVHVSTCVEDGRQLHSSLFVFCGLERSCSHCQTLASAITFSDISQTLIVIRKALLHWLYMCMFPILVIIHTHFISFHLVFKNVLFYRYIYVKMCIWVHVQYRRGRESEPCFLGLWVIVSHQTWILAIELRSSRRTTAMCILPPSDRSFSSKYTTHTLSFLRSGAQIHDNHVRGSSTLVRRTWGV